MVFLPGWQTLPHSSRCMGQRATCHTRNWDSHWLH